MFITLRPGRVRSAMAGAALAVSLVASPAMADPALDTIFDLRQLGTVETGSTHRFAYERANPAVENAAIEDGTMTLGVNVAGEGRVALLSIDDGQRTRTLDPFPGDAGNPLLLVFLENVARSVSEGTGGSPFYIRNRIKDAFRSGAEIETTEVELDGETITGERIIYTPFAKETQTDRLGIFTDLKLAFVFSDAVPGRVALLSAASGEGEKGYRETIAYVGEAQP